MRTLLLIIVTTLPLCGCRPSAKPTAAISSDATTSLPDTKNEASAKTDQEPVQQPHQGLAHEPAASGTAANHDHETPNESLPESLNESLNESATWTTERLVLAARGGPLLIELRVRVGEQDLSTCLHRAIAAQIEELGLKFEPATSWDELLKIPLVSSGWLGNLVPTDEQRSQFLSLYDTNGNAQVDDGEIEAFLTRGLSRKSRIRIGTGSSTDSAESSPWGPLDLDADGQLTKSEWSQAMQILTRFDFDGDLAVTRTEIQPERSADPGMGMSENRRTMIESRSSCSLDDAQIESTISTLLEAYSLDDSIAIDAFHLWSIEDRHKLDQNRDGNFTRSELKQLATWPVHCAINITLPDTINPSPESSDKSMSKSKTGGQLDVRMRGGAASTPSPSWQPRGLGGRLSSEGCVVNVRVRDDYGPGIHQQFTERLTSALADPAQFSFIRMALDLKSNAEELVRTSDGKPNVAKAWGWSTATRQANVVVNWSLPRDGWFDSIDSNGDGRIGERELRAFEKTAAHWDRDANGVLTADERPLAVLLAVERIDARGVFLTPGGTAIEKRGANAILAPTWFLGMDYNSDGELSRAEFLGESSDFDRLDLNGDGVIEASEVRH